MTALELAKEAAKTLNNKKGMDIRILRIENISSLADYFVFATGTSTTHLKEIGVAPHHVEGYRSNSWVLIDYGNVIVHIFTDESRQYYDLDRLWQDGEQVDTAFLQ